MHEAEVADSLELPELNRDPTPDGLCNRAVDSVVNSEL